MWKISIWDFCKLFVKKTDSDLRNYRSRFFSIICQNKPIRSDLVFSYCSFVIVPKKTDIIRKYKIRVNTAMYIRWKFCYFFSMLTGNTTETDLFTIHHSHYFYGETTRWTMEYNYPLYYQLMWITFVATIGYINH